MLAEQTPARYVAFDLLALDDEKLLDRPYAERRRALEELTAAGIDLTPLDARPRRGRAVAAPTARASSPRSSARPTGPAQRVGMVKVKRVRTIDAVVAGYRPGKEEGTVGSLILGLYDDAGGCTSSATPRDCALPRSAPSSSGSRLTRPASAATAIRAAGRARRTSSGSSCVRSWSSRSRSTTPAAVASATARRSCAGARTSRRPSAGSSRCSPELSRRLPPCR